MKTLDYSPHDPRRKRWQWMAIALSVVAAATIIGARLHLRRDNGPVLKNEPFVAVAQIAGPSDSRGLSEYASDSVMKVHHLLRPGRIKGTAVQLGGLTYSVAVSDAPEARKLIARAISEGKLSYVTVVPNRESTP